MAKLTPEQKIEIVANKDHKTGRELASQYGVSAMAISKLLKNPPAFAIKPVKALEDQERAELIARVLAMPARADTLTDAQLRAIDAAIDMPYNGRPRTIVERMNDALADPIRYTAFQWRQHG